MCSMEPILAEDQCPYRAPLCVENLELPSGGFSEVYYHAFWLRHLTTSFNPSRMSPHLKWLVGFSRIPGLEWVVRALKDML